MRTIFVCILSSCSFRIIILENSNSEDARTFIDHSGYADEMYPVYVVMIGALLQSKAFLLTDAGGFHICHVQFIFIVVGKEVTITVQNIANRVAS